MRQILNKRGSIVVEDVPTPTVIHGCVLVLNNYSLISSGTEVASLGELSENIFLRAIKNPKKIKKVLDKIKTYGVQNIGALVKEKLDMPKTLGYSCVGTVIAVGNNVEAICVGDKVACGGADYATHSEIVCVPKNLVAKLPEGVSLKEAAFTTIGSIALQGVRRANVQLGETVVVLGLGLIGQITSQILTAAGCRVICFDLIKERVDLAKKIGVEVGVYYSPVEFVQNYTDHVGADAVIIAAATKSDEPVRQAMEMCRKKGKIVVVGDVGLNLKRELFYKKELDFLISCSYGPGRYDPLYEERGLDYPIGYVRWTENRNMKEFLRLLKEKKVSVMPLVDSEFEIEKAVQAYERIQDVKSKPLAVLLKYGETKTDETKIVLSGNKKKFEKDKINVGVIGAGSFATTYHLPNLRRIEDYDIKAIVTATGNKAKFLAKQYNAGYCTTDYLEVLDDDEVDMVLIATRHGLHAEMILAAAKKGKDIFVEKPMAMSYNECDKVVKAVTKANINFTVGFNRRYAPFSIKAKELLREKKGPYMINYRVNAGFISKENWVHDPVEGGGRIIGECCHFFDYFNWVTVSKPKTIYAETISAENEFTVEDDSIISTIKYDDGSVASLFYTALGDKNMGKERIEIFKSGYSVVIDDFNSLIYSKKQLKSNIQDKGHYNELVEFAKKIKGKSSTSLGLEEGIKATVLSLRVVECLNTGGVIEFH